MSHPEKYLRQPGARQGQCDGPSARIASSHQCGVLSDEHQRLCRLIWESSPSQRKADESNGDAGDLTERERPMEQAPANSARKSGAAESNTAATPAGRKTSPKSPRLAGHQHDNADGARRPPVRAPKVTTVAIGERERKQDHCRDRKSAALPPLADAGRSGRP